ncbi:hypothetical protein V2H45_06970 [Tumidithrix elongata RA019]|uniref:AAA+ ATPase domain-containing protein n=1 Tax=Tumidithrix elongata BACA0141 TaxID=2716417 RepID=A0AAW9Q1I4_9CYAN|nr:hypothetical protein [Tumidithrix elongata RA019]
MSERLKFFRKLMAAFEGTADPRRAIEKGYYIAPPHNLIAEEIAGRCALRPSSAHLLFGGIGSGKTTQLLVVRDRLNEIEDIHAIYIDVSLYTDISDLQPRALVVIAGLEIAQLLGANSDPELQESRQIIEKRAYGYKETRFINSITSSLSLVINGGEQLIHHKGLLSTEKRETDSRLLQAFLHLKNAASQRLGEIVFIFDGLDRLNNTQTFLHSALNDVLELAKDGVGVIVVGSTPTVYSQDRENIERFASHSYYLSYLNVTEDIEAKQFFENIFTVRDPEGVITPEARELLITSSGGVLRDLMSLTQAAIQEAYVDSSDSIEEKHITNAASSLARSKILGLSDPSLEILQQVMQDVVFYPRTKEAFQLLLTGHILEYRYPKRGFVIHPILVPVIQNLTSSASHVAS